MKKIVFLALIVVMVLGCISLIACGGGGGGATTPPGGGTTPPGEEGTTPPSGGEETTTPEEELTDILGRGADLVSVKYEAVITAPGTPQQIMQVWFKQDKIRTEVTEYSETVIMIANFDTQVAYLYYPAINVAYQLDFEQAAELPLADAQSIPDYEYQIIGTEILDGKECLVVEYTVPAEQATVKMWVWKEYGIPIRAEMTTSAGTTIAEYRNLEFGDILDSMFELPPGVTIVEL